MTSNTPAPKCPKCGYETHTSHHFIACKLFEDVSQPPAPSFLDHERNYLRVEDLEPAPSEPFIGPTYICKTCFAERPLERHAEFCLKGESKPPSDWPATRDAAAEACAQDAFPMSFHERERNTTKWIGQRMANLGYAKGLEDGRAEVEALRSSFASHHKATERLERELFDLKTRAGNRKYVLELEDANAELRAENKKLKAELAETDELYQEEIARAIKYLNERDNYIEIAQAAETDAKFFEKERDALSEQCDSFVKDIALATKDTAYYHSPEEDIKIIRAILTEAVEKYKRMKEGE